MSLVAQNFRARVRHAAILASIVALTACPDKTTAPADLVPKSLLVSSLEAQTAVAGTVALSAPAVMAVTEDGEPVPGVRVRFSVLSGKGTLTTTSATTDGAGIARSDMWLLGTKAGTQTVRAEVKKLDPIVFSVTAIAGPATQMSVAAGNNQQARTGSSVPTRPSVLLMDANGNPVPGVLVTFHAQGGKSTITNDTTTTGAEGTASVGAWTLGVEPGTHTMRASAGKLSATFTATANLPTGCVSAPYAIGATITGLWEKGDCVAAGGVYDQYRLTVGRQSRIATSLAGAAGHSIRIRRKATGEVVAPASPQSSEVKYVLTPGAYVIEVQSPATAASGSYTLSTSLDTTAGGHTSSVPR